MVVVAISIDRGRDEKVRKLVKGYVNRKKLTFPNLLDPKSATAEQYGVRGVPMNFFINPQGKIVAAASGYRNWDSDEAHKMFQQLLSGAS
jgi:peroxiredoxin